MPPSSAPVHCPPISASREAYLLLGMLIERTGMRRTAFLAGLAELGYEVGDDAFTNWGRPERAFPRDWALLRALIVVLRDPNLDRRCTVVEALRFFALTELPFAELSALTELFPADELGPALVAYLPIPVVSQSLEVGASAQSLEAALGDYERSLDDGSIYRRGSPYRRNSGK